MEQSLIVSDATRKAREKCDARDILFERFDPDTKKDDIAMADYGALDRLEGYTNDYLAVDERWNMIRRVAQRLVDSEQTARYSSSE
jgi:hypothetical protein